MANARYPHRPFAGNYQEWQYINAPKNKDEASFRKPPEKIAAIELPSRVYETGEAPVPGFLPNLPDLREEVANYYSSVRRCDDTVGAILRALEAAGEERNTLVVFLSDNGMAFPFAKFSCYLHGTRTPVIARWPEVIEPGNIDRDNLIEAIDLAPTFLEAAGVRVPDGMEGNSLIPLMKGGDGEGFDQAFTAFYMSVLQEEVPTRSIQEGKYGYIFNLWADGGFQAQNELYKGLALRSMVAASQTNPEVAKRTMFFLFRVREELYDFSSDPNGLHNLAARPEHRSTFMRLRKELLEWMRRTDDPMAEDFEAYLRGDFGDFSGPESPGETAGRGRYTPPE